MSSFRTVFTPQRATFSIAHPDRILMVGSCFTEHIGERLTALKYKVLLNPFGIVYNPASMAGCLQRLLAGNRPFEASDLFHHAGVWRSWEHHSRFALPDRAASLALINEAYVEAAAFLPTCNRLLLTFGTADIFTLADSGQVVANNHKMPAALFHAGRLTVAGMTDQLAQVLQALHEQNPDMEVVLTVSPVRHLRKGMVENQRSKAALLLCCEALCARLPFVHYFPAYELMMDDLRDYRFYTSDMLHPSEVAIDYVWDFLGQTFFSPETRALNTELEKLLAAARHRPFNPETPEHKTFARQQLVHIADLQQRHPGLDLAAEKRQFEAWAD